MRMKQNILYFIIFFFILRSGYSQFKQNIPIQELPTNMNGELESSFSIFDSNRFNMSHGFSMSMLQINNHNISIAGYTNQINYYFNENLIFNSNIILFKNNTPFYLENSTYLDQINMGYELGLQYKPSKNYFLELKMKSLPYYQNHSPNSYQYNGLFD